MSKRVKFNSLYWLNEILVLVAINVFALFYPFVLAGEDLHKKIFKRVWKHKENFECTSPDSYGYLTVVLDSLQDKGLIVESINYWSEYSYSCRFGISIADEKAIIPKYNLIYLMVVFLVFQLSGVVLNSALAN